MQNEIEEANPWVSEWPADRRPSGLMTKCYGPITKCYGLYKGESHA